MSKTVKTKFLYRERSYGAMEKSLLTKVITRIDYEDQIEISNDKQLSLKNLCIDNKIDRIDSRILDSEQDFSTSDATPFRILPEEYIKTVPCKVFYNDEFILEINPYFMRIIQSVTPNYQDYKANHLKLVKDAFTILSIPNSQIQRISIRKCDEIYYDTINAMEQYFKSEIIQNNIFGTEQNWNVPQAESSIAQNFEYRNFRVNFLRYIDRGRFREESTDGTDISYREKILYRLFLDYEVYSRDTIENYSAVLLCLNEITEALFWETFNENGKKILIEGGDFGNYVQ